MIPGENFRFESAAMELVESVKARARLKTHAEALRLSVSLTKALLEDGIISVNAKSDGSFHIRVKL